MPSGLTGGGGGSEMAAAQREKKAMEAKVAAVREVVSGFSKDQILLVLQHFDQDVAKAIAAFCQDGAQEVFSTWTGGVATKSRRPKGKQSHAANGHGKANGNGTAETAPTPTPHPHPPTSAAAPSPAPAKANPVSNGLPPQAPKPQRSPRKPRNAGPAKEEKAAPPPERERLISSSSSVSEAAGKKKTLEKELKELQRKEAAMSRSGERFKSEMESAGERLRRAFAEVRDALDAREAALKAELAAVKAEGNRCLSEKEDYAHRLRAQAERAPSLSEREMDLLRHDIHAFTSERRQDQDLASTIRFQYEPHPMADMIAKFGLIPHIAPAKASHPTSSPPLSDNAPPQHQPSPPRPDVAGPVTAAMEVGGISMKSSSLTSEELAEINRKLQESLQSQGISGSVLGILSNTSNTPPPRRPPPNHKRSAPKPKANANAKAKTPPQPNISLFQ